MSQSTESRQSTLTELGVCIALDSFPGERESPFCHRSQKCTVIKVRRTTLPQNYIQSSGVRRGIAMNFPGKLLMLIGLSTIVYHDGQLSCEHVLRSESYLRSKDNIYRVTLWLLCIGIKNLPASFAKNAFSIGRHRCPWSSMAE